MLSKKKKKKRNLSPHLATDELTQTERERYTIQQISAGYSSPKEGPSKAFSTNILIH
jgi:hypothetical protein